MPTSLCVVYCRYPYVHIIQYISICLPLLFLCLLHETIANNEVYENFVHIHAENESEASERDYFGLHLCMWIDYGGDRVLMIGNCAYDNDSLSTKTKTMEYEMKTFASEFVYSFDTLSGINIKWNSSAVCVCPHLCRILCARNNEYGCEL